MKTFYVNPNTGDIEIDNLNNIKMIEGSGEVKQRTELSLKTNKGEWVFNLDFGISWLDYFNNRISQEKLIQEITRTLQDDDAIEDIDYVNIVEDEDSRSLKVDFQCTLTNGEQYQYEVEVI